MVALTTYPPITDEGVPLPHTADPIKTNRIVILLHSLMTTSELPFECFCVCVFVFDDRTETTIGASALY